MEPRVTVKVVVYPAHYRPNYLCFNLVFDDGSYKYYELDHYERMAYRMSERDLMAHLAQDYYEQLTGNRPEISLIFY